MVINVIYNKQTKDISLMSDYGDEIPLEILENKIDNDNTLNFKISFTDTYFENMYYTEPGYPIDEA